MAQLRLELGAEIQRTPSLRDTARVEQHLRACIGPGVILKLTTNTSTMISFRRRGRALYVRAHKMFADAPQPVIDALARFVSQDDLSKPDAHLLDAYIEAHRPQKKMRQTALQPFGEVHDLKASFDRLNRRYFDDRIAADITWSTAPNKRRRASIKMGSYCEEERLIRIHPALDQCFVPRYFVDFVVYHEMLHQVHETPQRGRRRQVHTPAFRAAEKRFAHYDKAMRWERNNLARLMRW
jgi:hypothetical protein